MNRTTGEDPGTRNGSVARGRGRVVRPVVVLVGLRGGGLRGPLAAVKLVRERTEVRLVSAVLQITGNFGLLCLSSAASHWVDPLAHMAGALAASGFRLSW